MLRAIYFTHVCANWRLFPAAVESKDPDIPAYRVIDTQRGVNGIFTVEIFVGGRDKISTDSHGDISFGNGAADDSATVHLEVASTIRVRFSEEQNKPHTRLTGSSQFMRCSATRYNGKRSATAQSTLARSAQHPAITATPQRHRKIKLRQPRYKQ